MSATSVVIRPMVLEDAQSVALIQHLSWKKTYSGIVEQSFLEAMDLNKSAENWRKGIEVTYPDLFRLVAVVNQSVVAFICGKENRNLELLPNSDCELWAIYADPSCVGKGIGRSLLNKFILELKTIGKSRMCVWVLKDNTIGRDFYVRHGGVLSNVVKEIKIGEQQLVEVSYEYNL